MPLQNRVTPFGDIIATPARGMFTGNRGIIHDPATRTLLRRRWTTKSWIVCACEWKGIRRDVMGGRSWTELFFLDEATALAAGHRPCFLCRREALPEGSGRTISRRLVLRQSHDETIGPDDGCDLAPGAAAGT